MSWNCYKLIYRALSPVCIGSQRLGMIQRTYYYISGRGMWGAITATLTRKLYKESSPTAKNYQEVGDVLKRYILPAYFFPTLNSDGSSPLTPKFTDTEIHYGGLTPADFEKQFIGSFGQTAIEAQTLTSEDGSLHETEFISPKTENEHNRQIYSVGHIFVKEGVKYNDRLINWDSGDIKLKEVLSELFVGGERTYGFGKLVLEKQILDIANDLFEYKLLLGDVRPKVAVTEDMPIFAHAEVEGITISRGDIEPVVGREWCEERGGPGRRISNAKVCYIPGSIVEKTVNFEVGDYGIWKPVK